MAEDTISFNVYKNAKHPGNGEEVFSCEVIDELSCDEYVRILRKDPLEAVIMDGIEIDDFETEPDTHLAVPELSYSVAQLENVPSLSLKKIWKEDLGRDEPSPIEEKEELKQLPSLLKYAFLEEGEKKPVIISSTLTSLQEEKLLRVLKGHKSTLGWTIGDIKGITLLFACIKSY